MTSQVHGPDGTTESETASWSRVRYTGYCLLVVTSQPAERPGAMSTLTVRGLTADGTELDRVTLARLAFPPALPARRPGRSSGQVPAPVLAPVGVTMVPGAVRQVMTSKK